MSESDPPGLGVILVVEDDEGVRTLTGRMLEQAGYQVLMAADASEALVILWETRVQIDVVVSDLMMPGMNGETLCGLISAHAPACKFVFMSGYPGTRTLPGPLVAKPFEMADLLGAVRGVLETSLAPPSGG